MAWTSTPPCVERSLPAVTDSHVAVMDNGPGSSDPGPFPISRPCRGAAAFSSRSDRGRRRAASRRRGRRRRSRRVDVDVGAVPTAKPATEDEVCDDCEKNQYDDRPDPARAAPIRAWSVGNLNVRHVSPEVDVERPADRRWWIHPANRPRRQHIAGIVPAMSSSGRIIAGFFFSGAVGKASSPYRRTVTPTNTARPDAGS